MSHFDIKHDLKSSLVVFLVALPLCLGIALASNAPLASGLLAGIIGGIVIGLLSDSPISVSGPAAGLTVIVANGITQLGSFETFCLAVFVAGIFQILFGLVRGGALGNYFPTAVIRGMLAAIGLILIMKQLPYALGLPTHFLWSEFVSSLHLGIIFISIVSFILMLTWEKLGSRGVVFFKYVPGALVAVITSVVLNELYKMAVPEIVVEGKHLVQLPFTDGFREIFSGFKLPSLSKILEGKVLIIGLTIAIVASLETLLCIDAADKIDPEKRKTSKNRELLAQGVGNALAGLIGALPLTAVIVRTTANVSSGAKTKVSAIFHGCWLLLCVALIPSLLNLIPLASLACILLMVGYRLTRPSFFLDMQRKGWDQLVIFASTILAILLTDLLIGIGIGYLVALAFELRSPPVQSFEVSEENNKVHIRFIKNVSFLHKPRVLEILGKVKSGQAIHIHNFESVRVHIDIHDLIREYQAEAQKKDIEIIYC